MESAEGVEAQFITHLDGDDVVFQYADPEHRAQQVRLWTDLDLGDTTFRQVPGGWQWRLTDSPVDRVEYLCVVDDVMVLDPGNPNQVDGAFGPHSTLALPTYREPTWLGVPVVDHHRLPATFATTIGEINAEIWSPADATSDEPLPMLISHDGPEMDRFGELTSYVGAMVGAGALPRMRVCLLAPGDRNQRYSANPEYAKALVAEVIPELLQKCPSPIRPVLLGQSLGALAALHAAWTSPETFAGIVLQSGSFFTPVLDPQERQFEFFAEITRFVAEVHATRKAPAGLPPIAFTCGTAEENLRNNRRMFKHLTKIGADTSWGQLRDGHTWTCWRDTLDPHLTRTLTEVCN